LARKQDKLVSEWGDMFICGWLFQKDPTYVGLVQSGPYHSLIESLLVLVMILVNNCWVGV